MGAEAALFKPDWLSYPSAPADLDPVIWMPSFTRTESGELEVDGTSVSRLVADFGTPEYVFSETTFRARAAEFRSAFDQFWQHIFFFFFTIIASFDINLHKAFEFDFRAISNKSNTILN